MTTYNLGPDILIIVSIKVSIVLLAALFAFGPQSVRIKELVARAEQRSGQPGFAGASARV